MSIQEKQKYGQFITNKEIAEIMKCSISTAQRIGRTVNNAMKAEGFITVQGRTNRAYFEKMTGAKLD